MKTNIILGFVFILTFLSGCSTPHKLASSTKEATKVEAKRTEAVSNEVTTFVDTTKVEGTEITHIRVDFYPPESSGQTPTNKGAIKSIDVTKISQKKEAAGVSGTTEKEEMTKSEGINSDTTSEIETIEQPAPDPYRWRYILGIGVLLATGLLYWKRIPVWNWIQTILAGIRRIF
ncbi:hypothetical protein EZS27_001742 [termite gut metagenome]|uniref:Uncharacterized protein n=1 Tax=termite gut metagenome TaxID=433724 RepID=A0A5J4T0J7_9ZZZZ